MVRWNKIQLARYLAEVGALSKSSDGKPRTQVVAEKREVNLQLACEAWLNEKEIWWFHDNDSRKNRDGIPDLIICYGGRFVVCELKSADGKVKPSQKREMARIRRSGGRTFIARSLEEFIGKLVNGTSEQYLR